MASSLNLKPRLAVAKTFTKGGQVTLHNLRMIRQVLWVTVMVTLIGGALFWGVKTWMGYTSYQRAVIMSAYWADTRLALSGNKAGEIQGFLFENGQAHPVRSLDIQQNPFIQALVDSFEARLGANLYPTLWFMAGLFLGLCGFWFWRGQIKKAREILSGPQVVAPKTLQRLLTRQNLVSPLALAGVNLRQGAETQHMMVCGTTGTGKSTCLAQLLPQIRTLGQRAIIVDTTGEFVARFYRDGQDILLNPFDARSVGWHPWADCPLPYHFDELAQAFIPQTGHDRFWADAARTVLAEGLRLLGAQQCEEASTLVTLLLETSLKDLFEALRDTPAASLVDPAGDRTAMSIRAHLTPYLKPLRYLDPDKLAFSIREWVQKGDAPTLKEDAPWLFIASTPGQRETLRPLITALISSAFNSLLGMAPDPGRRLWFVVDELVSLNRQEALPKALAETRKYGGCIAVGVQNIPQVQELYGLPETKSLTSLFNTKVIFRNGDPETARQLSQMLGEQEVREAVEGISYGAHQMRDGVSLNEHKRLKPVVSASDIMDLDDLEAYLKLPGNLPVAKIRFEMGQSLKVCEAFVSVTPGHPEEKSGQTSALASTSLHIHDLPTE